MEKERKKVSSYRNSDEQIAEKFKNLLAIIEIMDSNCNEYQKAFEVLKLYSSVENFRKAYGLILKFGKNDPMFSQYLGRIAEIYTILLDLEQRGIIDSVNYLIKIEKYLETYKYAKFVIDSYIASNHSYRKTQFLEEMGIDENTFDYCIRVIEELDTDLLDSYNAKKEKNKKSRYFGTIYTFKNIANGISTGFLFDGSPFDALVFWKLIPFKYSHGARKEFDEYIKINPNIYYISDNFYSKIKNFTQATIPEESKIILEYMRTNRIYSYRYISEHEFKRLYLGLSIVVNNKYGVPTQVDNPEKAIEKISGHSKSTLVGKNAFSLEDANNVIRYMKINKLPSLIEVYSIVQKKYVNGEITVEEINHQERNNKVRVLVP